MLPEISREELLVLFRNVLIMRRFEERLVLLSREHSIGHFHLYIGQECTGAPALSLVKPGDFLFTTHRNHGHLLARGADPGRVLAEILGKATGYNKGKGGSFHICARELGFLTTSGIVGGILPLASGAAFAAKQRGEDRVALCLFGDGVLEEGVFYEAVNIASLWSLPVVFLCENNGLEPPGEKTGGYRSATIAAQRLTDLLQPFHVPAISIDGTSAGMVHQAVREAIKRARQGDGPSFIEAGTVRWPGSRVHWPDHPKLVTGELELRMAWEPGRIPEEFRQWHASLDGVLCFARELVQSGGATPDELLQLDKEARARMDEAVRFALESPLPRAEQAFQDVFI